MSDFSQLAQSLTVALKALQMYTATHPRTQEALVSAQAGLEAWMREQPRLQFVVSGAKCFLDGQVLDTRSPHIATLAKLVAEHGVGGFLFERGVAAEELLAFLQGLATKPARLEEQGGFEALLKARSVRHIRVTQTRYQEVREGDAAGGAEDRAPAVDPAPSAPSPAEGQDLARALQETLLAALRGGAGGGPSGADPDGLGFLQSLPPADLGGLSGLGDQLGLGGGAPSEAQVATLRTALLGLPLEAQVAFLVALPQLGSLPAGLGQALQSLAGEVLASATLGLLARGAAWPQLRGPLHGILKPLADRDALALTLASRLIASGQDATPVEVLLRHLEWDALSLEAKLLKVLEEGFLFELSLEQRLALLRELLDLRRHEAFLRIQEQLLEGLRHDSQALRLASAQTLAGMARWALVPGLPPESEGPLAEGLRAHFAWEPDPPLHRWTAEGLEALLAALATRGELGAVLSDLQELEGLCTMLEEQHPWRREALAGLLHSLVKPDLLDAVLAHAFNLSRERVVIEVQPFLEALGTSAARHLIQRLGEEADRTRRGRLVDLVRGMGGAALPMLLEALNAPAWYLVRNALTLLADLGDAGCVPVLPPLLKHPEPRVRRVAVRALWKLGGPVAEPHLLARIKDTDAETLQEIFFALGQLRSEASLSAVAELAQDRRVAERLRIQALDTLGAIGSPKALPALEACARRKGFFGGGGEAPPIRLAAARAMIALVGPEGPTALRRLLEAEPKGEEREAFRRLLEKGGPA